MIKKYFYFGKLFFLFFLIISCNSQREDEYDCKYKDKSREIIMIKKDTMIRNVGEKELVYKVSRETSDKIEAIDEIGNVSTWTLIFYKNSKKIRISRKGKKSSKDNFTYILTCEKLN